MSNRAKDECITIEGDIETILKEHVADTNRTPDEWCVKCGDWPCPPLYVASKLMEMLEVLKTIEDPQLVYSSLKKIIDEPNKSKNKKKISYTEDHTCNDWDIYGREGRPCLACALILK